MAAHLRDTGVAPAGQQLAGKHVTLCVTGGIAAIETPKLARHLRRHGAEVRAVMSPDAEQFITPRCLEWATGAPVVSSLSGSAEHIGPADLVLVAPATLNTISKAALGIADTPVTAVLASALGAKTPVAFCPTMHQSMWDNPILQSNLRQLEALGARRIPPRIEEGKAKLPLVESIVHQAIRMLADGPLAGRRILITAGPTRGWIDDIRFVTNRSSGALGVLLARQLWLAGAEVTLIYGPGSAPPPPEVDIVPVETAGQMLDATLDALTRRKHDAAIFTAAVLDFEPETKAAGKLPTAVHTLRLTPTQKVIREVSSRFPSLFIIGFKLEAGMLEERLISKATKEREHQGSTIIVANRLEDITVGQHIALLLDGNGLRRRVASKEELTHALIDELGTRLGGGTHDRREP